MIDPFMNQFMVENGYVAVGNTVEKLSLMLRSYLRDLGGGIRHGDRRVVDRMLGPDRTFIASPYFGLADMQIIHQFLGQNVTAPTGAFAITVGGIQQQMLGHARCLRPLSPPPPPHRDGHDEPPPRVNSQPR